ncbi:DUF4974 domain-containing protein [Alistipes sp. OttesenSCG-928-B03]|nr:DUF4974 domain-containing protein [Alistipes sp. OttesenSCG-928-B03]
MKNINNTIERIVRYYMTREYSADLVGAVQMWLREDVHFEEKDHSLWKVWNEIDPAVDARQIEESLRQVKQRLGLPEGDRVRPKKRRSLMLRVAAVLLPLVMIVGGVYLYQTTSSSDIEQRHIAFQIERTDTAETLKRIRLHDGTEVALNANSVIHHSEERVAKLEGEACFEVARDEERPFVLEADGLMVTVLGTVFNVNAYPDSDLSTVTLFEGRVEVDCAGRSYVLEPGTELVLNKATSEVELRSVESSRPQWMIDLVNFQHVPMSDIFRAMERVYEVTIDFDENSLKNDIITLRLHGGETVEEAMALLSRVSGKFSYSIENDNIVIIQTVP